MEIATELGLHKVAGKRLVSDIKKYIQQWDRWEILQEWNDANFKEHCDIYLERGWSMDERLNKDERRATIPPGKDYWKPLDSAAGWKRPKYEWPRDSESSVSHNHDCGFVC